MESVLDCLRGKLVVSCQAYEGEALFGSETMARMALAAKRGGAAGIRANHPDDIRAIKRKTRLPVIGIWKKEDEGSDVYITPTLNDALAVRRAGAEIVAMDATRRDRPGGESLASIVQEMKKQEGLLLMADVSTVEEGEYAQHIGFDIVSTTLSGYTPYSPKSDEPDYALLEALAGRLSVPVVAEGRIQTPAQAARCLRLGACFVVVGTAITRPHLLTEMFVKGLEQTDCSTVVPE
ncbi:N-acetylmannosamine-6-phosphate 2-epimerase [Cohnella hashimotonis]|uniref:Putative N-acetylmannosamine-6-phosphate 2-epimerase n=1 Tax=Cohnella hashimotonis TaxID=2826895 RepID=A0ABT6TDX8_9BACL|nr:N-acetylmannosamine-6-phosphate 2-epimerase [Cohnella hashimotonis]MDI4645015.1 N-acetylmannosamine-6-phosphate 2-epimerase [Cohnella hashimotonis]